MSGAARRGAKWVLLACVGLGACTVSYPSTSNGRPDGGACMLLSNVAYAQTFESFAIEANATTPIPPQTSGYSIVSDGAGSYTLNWTNANNDADCFNGRISATVPFATNDIRGISGQETVTTLSATQIGFASTPGVGLDGVAFFAAVDPVIVDVYLDAAQTVSIYYSDGATSSDTPTGANPASFHSP